MPRGYYPSSIMEGESSKISQTPEEFLRGGPSFPVGYQALSSTFLGVAPRPIEQVLSSSLNGIKTETSNAEQIFMISGNIMNPQPQGSQLPPREQFQGSQLPPGGQPQGSQLPPRGQPSGSQLPPGGQPSGSQLSPWGQPSRSQLPPGGQPQGRFFPGQTVESYYIGGQPQG